MTADLPAEEASLVCGQKGDTAFVPWCGSLVRTVFVL